MATATQPDAPHIAQPLAAYLERAQLTHLHAQVAELTDRLQAAEEALHTARAEVAEANESADMWRCTVTNILAEVREICEAPMPQGSQGVGINAVHRVHTPMHDAAEAKFNGLHRVGEAA